MNWFLFSIVALLCWSGSDLFSKIGCRDSADKYSQFKMVTAVGVVMGLHALYEIFFNRVEISFDIIITYLPVSLLYILSMTLGYVGLRYIELSVSSPVCNASGAIVAILSIFMFGFSNVENLGLQLAAIVCVCVGVIGLGIVEYREDDAARLARQSASNYKYSKSWLALALPIAYCLLDAAGSFSDAVVLDVFHLDFIQNNVAPEFSHLFAEGIPETFEGLISADKIPELDAFVTEMEEASAASANVAYELTFLFMGVIAFAITLVGFFKKKHTYSVKNEPAKYVGAIFETAGQFAYIFALADAEHVMFSAPIISSYCVVSVLWSRIFLKEKLSKWHYAAIAITVVGIAIMGFLDI